MGIAMIDIELALAIDAEHVSLMNTKILSIAQVYPFGKASLNNFMVSLGEVTNQVIVPEIGTAKAG